MYPVFDYYSTPRLLKAAETYRFEFASANGPIQAIVHAPKVLPANSRYSVRASSHGVRMDYSSPLVQQCVAKDVSAVEGLLTEAWERMKEDDHYPLSQVNLLLDLEHEVQVFLDFLKGTALLTKEDFREAVADISEFFGHRLAPR